MLVLKLFELQYFLVLSKTSSHQTKQTTMKIQGTVFFLMFFVKVH